MPAFVGEIMGNRNKKRDPFDTTSTLDALLAELAHLKEADKVLTSVWCDLGAYNDRNLSNETLEKMRNYFDFDDSE